MPAQVGTNKAVAAGLAGAVTTIVAYVLDQFVKTPIPLELVAAIQTVITTLLVYFVPHGGDA